MLDFCDLLLKEGLDLRKVNVVRHRAEVSLRQKFPWIASEHPELFDYYQSTQAPQREKMLLARDYLASFIGLEDGSTVFVGTYRKMGQKHLSRADFEADNRFKRLRDLGCMSFPEQHRIVFDYVELDSFRPLKGKLFIQWGAGLRAFIQVAANRAFPIVRLSEENALVEMLKHPYERRFSIAEIRELPSSWRERMSQWRGIYLITDVSDGARYVGSAYGSENLLQRWRSYAETGHGGNKLLRGRDAANFQFSILELLGMAEDQKGVVDKENSWKERLMSRRADSLLGLNDN